MKAVNAPAEPASGSRSPAPASALDPLKAIDVSSLDRLIAIRQEQDRIAGFREKAKEKKGAVTEAVYKRVMEDYSRRTTALEQQSAPLREQARAEYRKLKAVVDDVQRRQDQARLQKDELEFRAAIGELVAGDIDEKLRDPQGVLAQCESDRKQIDAIKARFVEAFGSEDALDTDDEEPPTREAMPARYDDPPTAAASPAPSSLRMAAAFVQARQPHPPAPPEEEIEGPTVVLPRGSRFEHAAESAARPMNVAAAPAPAPIQTPPPMPAVDDDDEDEEDEASTMMVAMAAVVIIEPAAASQEFQLATMNGIGRSDENQICLLHAGISRKHAVIKAIPGGFSIKDLGSQNGTFVNGQRVTEKALTDGDTIAVGSVRFVFRMPWSPSASATAPRANARSDKR